MAYSLLKYDSYGSDILIENKQKNQQKEWKPNFDAENLSTWISTWPFKTSFHLQRV